MWKSKWKGWLLLAVILLFAIWALGDFRIVEPEKRSYPMVIGLDWQAGQYQVYLVSASLSETTGQGKSGDEKQTGEGNGMVFLQGATEDEVRERYETERELYLDIGHVRAVVFGPGLLTDDEHYEKVLKRMEQDTALGNSAYAFRAEDVGRVLAANGNEVESLGAYLAGIYENRTDTGDPRTLAKLYNQMHQGQMPQTLPLVTLSDQGLKVR